MFLLQDLFFIGPFYHLEFPEEIKVLIALDIDLQFRQSIEEGVRPYSVVSKLVIITTNCTQN